MTIIIVWLYCYATVEILRFRSEERQRLRTEANAMRWAREES